MSSVTSFGMPLSDDISQTRMYMYVSLLLFTPRILYLHRSSCYLFGRQPLIWIMDNSHPVSPDDL